MSIHAIKAPFQFVFPTNLTMLFFISKKIKRYYISIKPNWHERRYRQSIQNQWKTIQNITQNYQINTGTYFQKYPNINLGLILQINQHFMNGQNHRYIQNIPSVNLTYDYKNLNFTADYQYIYTKDLSVNRSGYHIAGFSLIYQKDKSPWGVELQGQNLSDNRVIKSYQQSDFIISDTQISIQLRIVMLKLRYKL